MLYRSLIASAACVLVSCASDGAAEPVGSTASIVSLSPVGSDASSTTNLADPDVSLPKAATRQSLAVAGVRFLSTDGRQLEAQLEPACPEPIVTEIEVIETTDTVEVEVVGDVPASEPYDGYCSQDIARPGVVVQVTLDSALGDRDVLAHGVTIPWTVPRGLLMVSPSLAAAPNARGDAIIDDLGIAFSHEGQCPLVWPWQATTEPLRFPGPIAVRPGGEVIVFLAPMERPASGVVEVCPTAPLGAAVLSVPIPTDPSAVATGVIVHLQSSLVTGSGVIDPTRIWIDWQLG